MIRFKEQSKRVLSDLYKNSDYYHLTSNLWYLGKYKS